MKSFKLILLLLPFFIFQVSGQAQTPNISKNSIQAFFSYSEDREILISAHRGGKGYAGYPENCLETMQYIKKQIPSAIFEIDIARSKDGVLLLMHDNALERTTSGFGKVENKSWEAMSQLKLKDDAGKIVDYKIPLFKDVLDWAKQENAILTVDIKRSVDPEEVLHFIEKNNALQQSVIITYSFETAHKLYELNPEVVLSITIRNMEEFERAEMCGIPWKNMLAFTGLKESEKTLYARLHKNGVMCMLGTLGNLDKKAITKGDHLYKKWAKPGIDIFATDRPLEVKKAFAN